MLLQKHYICNCNLYGKYIKKKGLILPFESKEKIFPLSSS